MSLCRLLVGGRLLWLFRGYHFQLLAGHLLAKLPNEQSKLLDLVAITKDALEAFQQSGLALGQGTLRILLTFADFEVDHLHSQFSYRLESHLIFFDLSPPFQPIPSLEHRFAHQVDDTPEELLDLLRILRFVVQKLAEELLVRVDPENFLLSQRVYSILNLLALLVHLLSSQPTSHALTCAYCRFFRRLLREDLMG